MKSKLLYILLLLFCSFAANAQKLNFESFELDENDLSARTNQVLDANEQPCALVKVGLVVPKAEFNGYTVRVVPKTSEYWVYMIDDAREIKISAPGYLPFDYNFPKPLKKNFTYKLVLSVPYSNAAAQPQQPTQKTGFLVISATPKESDVYVNDEYLGSSPQPKRYAIGTTVSYKVSCDLYHDAEGAIEIDRMQTPLNVTLKPAFGSVRVMSEPTGAKVVLDGKSVGTTPLTLQKIASGNHTLKLQKEKYAPAEKRILVSDGQQTDASFSLESRFADITIRSLQGATIKIDGITKGTTSVNEQLMEGIYEVEAQLDGHKTAKQQLEVKAGQPQTITLNPVPQYGTLVVESNPFGADIYIGGKKIGTTPYVSDNLLIGNYDVVLRKQGYADFKTTARVQENQESTVSATMEEQTDKGEQNGHEWVDLGLSVKWATCNVGANKPEEYGNYYAWGETRTKSVYSWSTYKWCNGSSTSMTKYCTSSSYGTVDNKTTLDLADDAARANWGGAWRMPTKAEQDELRTKCTWTWTTQGGVSGYKVTSKTNGNSIFLPAAGYRNEGSLSDAGSYGLYWSSSLGTSYSNRAYYLSFGSGSVDWGIYSRYGGRSVRAVCP